MTSKRIYYIEIEGDTTIAFNSLLAARKYLIETYNVYVIAEDDGWLGFDYDGNEYWIKSSVVHFNKRSVTWPS